MLEGSVPSDGDSNEERRRIVERLSGAGAGAEGGTDTDTGGRFLLEVERESLVSTARLLVNAFIVLWALVMFGYVTQAPIGEGGPSSVMNNTVVSENVSEAVVWTNDTISLIVGVVTAVGTGG